MRQLVFEFVADYVAESGIVLDPRIEEELIAHMAEAIVAVIGAEGGQDDEEHCAES